MASSAEKASQQVAEGLKQHPETLNPVELLVQQLQEMQKLQKRVQLGKKIESDFLVHLDLAVKKVLAGLEKNDALSLEKFRSFQKKCREFFNEIKSHADEMVALADAHNRDLSYLVMNGLDRVKENCKIVLDIVNNFLNDTSLTLEYIAKENFDTNCHNHIYFYLESFNYFTQQVLQAKTNIAKLPAILAADVKKIIDKDKAVMYKFY